MQRELKKEPKSHDESPKTSNEKSINNSNNRRSILPVLPGLDRILVKRKYPVSPTASIDNKNVFTIPISSTKSTKSSPLRGPSPKRLKKETKIVKSIATAGGAGGVHDLAPSAIPTTTKKRKTLKELKYEKLKRHATTCNTKNLQTMLERDQRGVVVNKLTSKNNNGESGNTTTSPLVDVASCSTCETIINNTLFFSDDICDGNKKCVKQLFRSNDDWSSDSSD